MLMMRVMMMMTMMNLIMDLTPLLPKICQAAVVAHCINTKRRVPKAAKGWLGLLLRINNATCRSDWAVEELVVWGVDYGVGRQANV